MQRKSISGVAIKDADQGLFSAVICTFNAVDHDGDVVVPGAFTDGEQVRLSTYNHGSWGKGNEALPIGKGAIRVTDTEAIFDGQVFMATQAGRETFEVIKQMDDLQEYSWGFDILEADQGAIDGQSVQFIRSVKVYEVSPVLLGASIGTRTLAVKSQKQLVSDIFEGLRDAGRERFGGADTYVYVEDVDLDEGYAVFDVCSPNEDRDLRVAILRGADGSVALGDEVVEVEEVTTYEPVKARREAATAPGRFEGTKLADQIAAVAADAVGVTERLSEVVTLRAEEGKSLGEQSQEAAAELAGSLESAAKALREVVTSADADNEPEAKADDADVVAEAALTLEDETALSETLARYGLSL